MRRCIAAVVLGLAFFLPGADQALAQTQRAARGSDSVWKDTFADSLIHRAILLRRTQLADSTLLSYRANAHGFLAFLAQLGEGYIIPPKVVQTEELALTLAWWQPGRSAQQLVGRRDTTLLPADVGYYRDRYAVVLDNLPDRVRLGDGFDVADVPHPLSADAATRYEYRRGNGFQISVNGRKIDVDEVEFRPRDATKPGAIGSVYLDRTSGAVVRLSMTFTRAAILDKRIETLVVTLINGLINERYWLPTRQEVEVVRSSTWLDIPVKGIVRGHWAISGYEVNERIPALTLSLPRWSSVSLAMQRAYKFDGVIADMLPPEMRLAGDDDVAQARKMAESAVRAAVLAQPRKSSAFGRGLSDLVRFNRTEGIAAGLGLSRHWGDAWQTTIGARYGFSDRQVKGRLTLGRAPALGGPPLWEAFVERDYRDVAPPERSGVVNSLAAMAGSDFTTQVDTYAAGIRYRPSSLSRFTLHVAAEVDEPLSVEGRPITQTFEPTLPAWKLRGARAELRGGGSSFKPEAPQTRRLWSISLAAGAYTGTNLLDSSVAPIAARVMGDITFERSFSKERLLVLRTTGGFAAGKSLPPQWLVFAGGPYSAPGYAWSSLAGRSLVSQRIEFRQPIPAPSIPLRKYGRAPGRLILAPYMQATALGGAADLSANRNGVYPSVGLGALMFFDLLRFDVARDLRHRRWSFGFDIDRAFWGVL